MIDSSQTKFKAALVQLRSGREVGPNIKTAVSFIGEAAARGAHYIQTPETTSMLELERERVLARAEPEKDNTVLRTFVDLARELKIWLHIGSISIKCGPDKVANRSYLISPAGEITARYDKIHMFDVDLPGGESYRESESYVAGDRVVLAALPWGWMGLSICYDLRFAALYRALAKAGASILCVPSAFTRVTGKAHWHVLLRARAIETGSFVFAAAQGGRHENGRSTYGHSLIVSPWGEVLAEAGIEPGVIYADIDISEVAQARARIPSLTHDRPYELEPTIEPVDSSLERKAS